MSKLKYVVPPKVKDAQFDDFMADFYENVGSVQDPEDADEVISDLTAKFNSLLASMREAGLIK